MLDFGPTVLVDLGLVAAAIKRRADIPNLRRSEHFYFAATSSIVLEICPDPGLRERRLSWAELMKRVFREDVLRCKKCGERAAVISAIAQPKVVEAILVCLGLAVRAPPTTSARQIPFDL